MSTANNSNPTSSNDAYEKAHAELSSLNRVYHKLALTEAGEPLQKVLSLLLPRLLERIGINHKLVLSTKTAITSTALKDIYNQIHLKLVDMISHIMKRSREDRSMKLPCMSILSLLYDETTKEITANLDPFTLNLSLSFLTLGLSRYNGEEKEELVELLHGFLILIGSYSDCYIKVSKAKQTQFYQVSHLVLRSIELLVTTTNNMNKDPNKSSSELEEKMNKIRMLCNTNPIISYTLYNLLLDGLLYANTTTTTNTSPSFGLSKNGYERLQSGTISSNTTSLTWKQEYASSIKLKQFKMNLLDFITPSRRTWCVLFAQPSDDGVNDNSIGIVRTILLLVIASGDDHLDVSNYAMEYLKIYIDNYKNKTTSYLGNPILLTIYMLSLVTGDIAFQKILKEQKQDNVKQLPNGCDKDWTRRMVSDKAITTIFNFISLRIVEEIPQLFDATSSVIIGNLVLSASNYCFLNSSSNRIIVSNNNSGGMNPRISFIQLLNLFTIQFCKVYDTSTINDNNDLKNILGKIVEIALSALLSTSSSTTSSNNETNVRDSCYGILCTLCRSQFVLCPEGILFHGYCSSSSEEALLKISNLSTTTTSQLFHCIMYEIESLRPRAIATLDALLGAYLRVYDATANVTDGVDITHTSFNPWATSSTNSNGDKAPNNERKIIEEEWKNVSNTLIPLLWNAATSSSNNSKACKYASVQWSKLLLKKISYIQSCHILCYLSGVDDLNISSIAKDGLDNLIYNDDDTSDVTISSEDLSQIMSILFQTNATNTFISSQRPIYKDFTPKSKGVTLRFILHNILNDLYDTTNNNLLHQFMNVVRESLANHSNESLDFLEDCSYCLSVCLSSSLQLRLGILEEDGFNYKSMILLCLSAGKSSSKARRYLANCCSYIFEDDSLWVDCSYDLLYPMKICVHVLENKLDGTVRSNGEIHGAAFLGASCIRAIRVLQQKNIDLIEKQGESTSNQYYDIASRIIFALGKGVLLHTTTSSGTPSDESIAYACADSIHIAFSSTTNTNISNTITTNANCCYYDNVVPILNTKFYKATAYAIQNITIGLQKYGAGEYTDAIRFTKLIDASASILSASTSGSGVQSPDSIGIGSARLNCIDMLFSLLGTSTASRKDPIIDLYIGEALVCYADTIPSVDSVIWSSETRKRPSEYDADYARSLPPYIQVIYNLIEKESKSTSPLKRNACCPALLAMVGHAAKLVNMNDYLKNRMFVTEARRYLEDVQNIFVKMLSDTKIKQFARESCCLGLAACRGLSCVTDDEDVFVDKDLLNDRLLKAFGQTTNYGGSSLMETRAQEAERRAENNTGDNTSSMTEDFGLGTEVGGVAGLGESALSAFREMASAALSLNRPDILYLLMTLSVSDPIWSSPTARNKYNASSLLGYSGGNSGSIVKEIREVIRPHLSRLLPRLLRACYDPNKQTQDQMGAIWTAVAGEGPESRALITQHFTNILDTLLEDAANKLWRARLGACGALANIVVGRSWAELGGGSAVTNDDDLNEVAKTSKCAAGIRLLRLWKVTTRGLDDVRSNVREGAENLSRSITSLTIRLCDPTLGDDSDTNGGNRSRVSEKDFEVFSSAAASSALWWLMKYGLNQPCPEAIGGCISCLLGIVEISKPSTLQPVLPDLIGSLAMAISGLEPSVLSYLQARASGESLRSSDRIERVRLQIAQSGPINSALVKCLDMVRHTPIETQRAVIPELGMALRSGAGFATRVAAADGVNLLCNTCPAAFKFPGSSNTNPTVRLLRALHFASERERGSAAQDRLIHALGSVACVAPGSAVRLLALKACKKYISSTGSNDDPRARKVAVSVLRSITMRATEQYAEGGPNDIWCKNVLPLAYLGMRDKDEVIASQWSDIWNEGSSVAVTTRKRKDFDCSATTSLEEALLPYIIHISVAALNDVVWSRRLSGCNALANLVDMNILSPLASTTKQNSAVDDDLSLRRKKQRTQSSGTALTLCIKLMIRSRIWTGKAELVNTVVKLALKWLVVDDKNSDFSSCENKGFPRVPISIDFENENDLFLGDNYFFEDRTYECVFDELEEPVDKSDTEEDNNRIDTTEALEGDELITDESGDEFEKKEESCIDDGNQVISLLGLSKLLLSHAFLKSSSLESELLPYRAVCLKGLADILNEFDKNTSIDNQKTIVSEFKRTAHNLIKAKFLAQIKYEAKDQQPPLIFARTIDCLASSFWDNFGFKDEENVFQLAEILKNSCGPTQPAWKVREASLLASATLITKANSASLRKYGTIKIFYEAALHSSKDRKFWQVRIAGLKLLNNLVSRAQRLSDSSQLCQDMESNLERQSMLEALLPYKEKFLQLAKSSLADSEAKVSVVAGTICSTISWWP